MGRLCGNLGTRDEGLGARDAGTCGTGTRDVKYRDAGDTGTLMNVSFFVKMCYLWSVLDSIVQNHFGYLMMFTQNISVYRSKCTDYCDYG